MLDVKRSKSQCTGSRVIVKKVTSHRVFKNASALALMQIINYAVPLVVLLHLTNVLGVELYGVVAFVAGIVLLGFVLMDFGYSLSATNKIALNKEKVNFVSQVVTSIFIVKLALFFALSFALFLYSLFTKKYSDHQLVIAMSLVPILFQGMIPVWFFQGIEKMKNIAVVTMLAKFSFLLLVVFLIKDEKNYWQVPLLNGVGQFFAFIVALLLIYKAGYSLKFPRKKYITYVLRMNKGFFSSRVAVASYMQAGPVLLGLFATPAAVAFYSLAEQLYKVMQSAIAPIVQALYPYMSKEKNFSLYLKVSVFTIILVVIGSFVGYQISPFLVGWIFGDEWLPSISILNVFFVAILVHVCAVLTGYPICAALGQLKLANNSVIYGGVVYFILFFALYVSGQVSPMTVAAMMVLAEFYVLVHRIYGVFPGIRDQLKSHGV